VDFDFSKLPSSMDAVPKDFQGLYVQGPDGTIALRSDDPGVMAAVNAIKGLNGALVASRAEARNNRANKVDLSALSDYGSTVEEIAANITQKINDAGKNKNTAVEQQVAQIREEMGQKHALDLAGKDKVNEALRGQLYKHLVTSEAVKALSDAGAVDPDLILPMLSTLVGVVEENGGFDVRILGADGDPRYSTATGKPMSIPELVAEMKGNEKFGPLFKSEKKPGGGKGPGPSDLHQQAPELSSVDKIMAGLDKR